MYEYEHTHSMNLKKSVVLNEVDVLKNSQDTCALHPHRKLWAAKKCSVLAESAAFSACRAVVPLAPWLERCVFDTCGCDVGGDCECLCTAVAAYAHECARNGVPVRWRSMELCRELMGVYCMLLYYFLVYI